VSVGIYAIVQRGTGRLYIGCSVNIERRWRRHREDLRAGTHHSRTLQRAWKKHGPGAFDWVVVEIVRDVTLLRAREREWLKLHPFYNALQIQDGVVKHTSETRDRMTAAQLQRAERLRRSGLNRKSDEHRAKIAAAHTGKKASAEARSRMSASARRRGSDHLQTAEARQKSGAAQRGVPKSDTHRAAIKAAHLTCQCPPHVRARQRIQEEQL